MKVLLGVLTFLILSGCGATGPKFEGPSVVKPDQAIVYIYRPWGMMDGAASPTVQVNNQDLLELSNGGYHVTYLEPGTYTFAVKKGGFLSNWRANRLEVSFDVEAGKEYFLRLAAKVGDISSYGSVTSVSGNYYFGLIPKNIALNELKETKKN